MNRSNEKIPLWGRAIIGGIVGLVSLYFVEFIAIAVSVILFSVIINRVRFGYIPCWRDGSIFCIIAGAIIGATIGLLVGALVFSRLFGWGVDGAPMMFGAFAGNFIGGVAGGMYFNSRR